MRSRLITDLALSTASVAATVAGVVLLLGTVDDRLTSLVLLFGILGIAMQLGSLVLGLPWFVGASFAPLLFACGLAAASSDAKPAFVWVVVGCLWFVAAELAWEAIDRRDGLVRPRPVAIARFRDVAIVLALALGTGFMAVLGSGAPPVRSLPLQALVMLIFFVAAVQISRRIG